VHLPADKDTERAEWLEDLERFTKEARIALADVHERKALEADEASCDCLPEIINDQIVAYRSESTGDDTTSHHGKKLLCKHKVRVQWHKSRANAQRHRFGIVASCGFENYKIYCSACGKMHKRDTIGCNNHRVCVRCRGKRAHKMRKRFEQARLELLRKHKHELRGDTPGTQGRKRWGERFYTLTYPDTGSPEQDIEQLYAAWPRFLRRLRDHLERELGVDRKIARSCPFLRVVEITPGQTGGHCHLHVWLLVPFIHHALLRKWWAASLDEKAQARLPTRDLETELGMPIADALAAERDGSLSNDRCALLAAGRDRIDSRAMPATQLVWPVLDARNCYGNPALELIKYLVKDIHQGERVNACVFANIYLALESRRITITSLHFWQPPEPATCAACGVTGAMRLEMLPNPLERMEQRLARPPTKVRDKARATTEQAAG